MPTYKTPNVYIEEISTFPPSVAEVSTAIPAFIGYTQKATKGNIDLTLKPTRISSLLDYETLFGGAEPANFALTLDSEEEIQPFTPLPVNFFMHYALRLFFDNGGGSCYIVSVGDYTTPATIDNFRTALDVLKKEDEPTLILLTDAVNLAEAEYNELCQAALAQCNLLKDRFVIFDVKNEENGVENFRQGIGQEYLKYGAAYYPYLQTSLQYFYTDDSVTVNGSTLLGDDSIKKEKTALYNKIKAELDKQRVVLPPSAAVAGAYAKTDRDRGVWKAPANVSLASVIAPTIKINN
ncbi:MAG: phage tail sheath family protein, partial [Kamptonema sp. SIO4C4]|nr:phage tail sheath family protein [Kamptonema sp. SIO4C4]